MPEVSAAASGPGAFPLGSFLRSSSTQRTAGLLEAVAIRGRCASHLALDYPSMVFDSAGLGKHVEVKGLRVRPTQPGDSRRTLAGGWRRSAECALCSVASESALSTNMRPT